MSKSSLSIFILTLALLLPCVAHAQQDADSKQDPKQDTPPGEVKAFALPPMDDLHATRERPLFAPQRRPDDETPPEAETETQVVEEKPETLNFELTGVVMGTEMAIAILKNRDTQETVHLRQGENVETWSIEEIAPRRVVLRQDEKQVTLELFQDKVEGEDDAHPKPPTPNRPRVPTAPKAAQTNRQTSNQADPAMQRRNMQQERQKLQQKRLQLQRQELQREEQRLNQRRSGRRSLQQRGIQ
jgi:hypothetical protein